MRIWRLPSDSVLMKPSPVVVPVPAGAAVSGVTEDAFSVEADAVLVFSALVAAAPILAELDVEALSLPPQAASEMTMAAARLVPTNFLYSFIVLPPSR